MKEVKSFKNRSFSELRGEVAEFLKENPNIKIVGLDLDYEIERSFTSSGNPFYVGSHCMMLIYEEDE